ncbi:growth hormone-regulated TBC protein 1-A-like isoform X2 [Tachypleus tridentatus]|uniref:growth hormone-regulated TBC protein 1-A-like isoform X2 n=1 Tax=Tachypleus tridentatus TaxID=6853 RepID=UPI003FD55075
MAEVLRASVDPYGFERPDDFDYESYDDFMSNYLGILSRRAKKWEDLLGMEKSVKKGTKVKRYIRKGIPREYRGLVWMEVSKAQDLKDADPDLYSTLLSMPIPPEIVESIKIDIPRTFPDNIYFKVDSLDGKRQPLYNVLVAFAQKNPSVGYCQGLNFIAGILLLITEDEETTFWLLRILVEKILPDYYTKDMMGLLTDVEVLGELVRLKVPKVHEHLVSHDVTWALVASKWFICLFAEVLPVETILRIWDCLYYEGSKILFRVGVTLIKKNEEKILAAKNFPDIISVLKSITGDPLVTDCHLLMQAIFKEPGSFPRSLISRLRAQCRVKVQKQKEELKS